MSISIKLNVYVSYSLFLMEIIIFMELFSLLCAFNIKGWDTYTKFEERFYFCLKKVFLSLFMIAQKLPIGFYLNL